MERYSEKLVGNLLKCNAQRSSSASKTDIFIQQIEADSQAIRWETKWTVPQIQQLTSR